MFSCHGTLEAAQPAPHCSHYRSGHWAPRRRGALLPRLVPGRFRAVARAWLEAKQAVTGMVLPGTLCHREP